MKTAHFKFQPMKSTQVLLKLLVGELFLELFLLLLGVVFLLLTREVLFDVETGMRDNESDSAKQKCNICSTR